MDEQNKKDPKILSLALSNALEDIQPIATGGMALVFRARQPSLDRYVAVKRLKDELLRNEETMERFRREAKVLASVLHQNVAHVYDFVESANEAFILMEYIEGLDLSTIIQKLGSLPPEVACSVLLGVARGLNYIHSHHLIHRDIKPSNIRITNRGGVKLMDFGIVMDIENHGLTRPGMMVGSPSYLSPEQVLGDPINAQADIFLLGICFYEMLTGTRPFKEEGGETIFQRIRECKYIPAGEMNSAIPKPLRRILDRCLQKYPKDRYAQVSDLVHDVERFLGITKSQHTPDILLKFLDEEALMNPATTYTSEILEKKHFLDHFPWPSWLLAILVGTAAFLFGRYGIKTPPPVAPTLPPPQALKIK